MPGDKHLLLVIRLLGGRAGGAERLFCGTANLLAAAGYRVTVVHHESGDEPPAFPLDVPVVNLRGKRGAPEKLMRPLRALPPFDWLVRHSPFTRGLVAAIRELRPDAVISWLPSANTPALIAGWITGVPVIPTNHSVPEHDYEDASRWDPNPIDRALRRYALRAATRIHVLHPSFAAWFPEHLRDRVVAIPNYVSPEFTPSEAPRRDVVVAAGRLVPEKDHAILIDAWAKLRPRGWSLEIHGDGPHRGELERRLDAHGLPREILRGHSRDIVSVYRAAGLCVHPSRFEGFGLAVAEALACGTPVIGFTDCDALRELVHHDVNGLLVRRDPDALAAAIDRLVQDAGARARLSAAAAPSVRPYSLEAYRERWLALLDPVVA